RRARLAAAGPGRDGDRRWPLHDPLLADRGAPRVPPGAPHLRRAAADDRPPAGGRARMSAELRAELSEWPVEAAVADAWRKLAVARENPFVTPEWIEACV